MPNAVTLRAAWYGSALLRPPNKTSARRRSMQLQILRFGFLEDRDIGVGVFPEREKILICRLGFRSVALQHIGAGKLKVGESSNGIQH